MGSGERLGGAASADSVAGDDFAAPYGIREEGAEAR